MTRIHLSYPEAIFFTCIFILIGAIVTHLFNFQIKKKDIGKKVDRKFPEIISAEDEKLIFEDWKVAIESQRHFGTLLIRFRTIVLSILLGAITITLRFYTEILGERYVDILVGFLVFWIMCFIIDYFYYFKLLLGSVAYAEKFDEHPQLKEKGYFGLTKVINLFPSKRVSMNLVIGFYLIPIIVAATLVVLNHLI